MIFGKKLTKARVILMVVFAILLFLGVIVYFLFTKDRMPSVSQMLEKPMEVKQIDFAEVNPQFNFSAKIPIGFETEYLSSLRAINVYNPNLEGSSNIEKSQLYITFFKANNFLTLNTVDIIGVKKEKILEKDTVLYTISKKIKVPDFLGQPTWRNFTHKALDIRLSEESPSIFYSFAYSPQFSQKEFNNFIDSLNFR
ncbi:MAG: hypothetical protein FJZ43_01535 [Candidatus Staskawiczbacteria bacterium]|nr:hypothetical protein [Candidatus Staskawiczbacteria bacterium]